MARKFNEDYREEKPISFEPVEPKATDMSLKGVLERLRDKPRSVMFQSIGAGGYAIAIGNKTFKFSNHDFVTIDPSEVEALMTCERYGFDFFVLDGELRNAKR